MLSESEDESPPTVSSSRPLTCSICYSATAKYNCPRCGINYCSVNCYQSPRHAACSESFYRDCCRGELKGQKVDPMVRNRMLDILRSQSQNEKGSRRVPLTTTHGSSSSSSEGESDNDDDSADCDISLADRMSDLDLESDHQSDLIWSRLTSRERREFNRLVDSGRIGKLLPVWTPDWMSLAVINDDSSRDEKNSRLPPLIGLRSMFPSGRRPSASIVYALFEVLLAYVCVCRHFNGDHMQLVEEAAHLLLRLASSSLEPPSCSKSSPKVTKDPNRQTVVLNAASTSSISRHEQQPSTTVLASIQDRLGQARLPCSPSAMTCLVYDVDLIVNRPHALTKALDQSHLLVVKCRQQANSDSLRFASRKLTFLRSCFLNQADSEAIAWRAQVMPVFRKELGQLKRFMEADYSKRDQPSTRPVRPAAGPSWAQMIRDDRPRLLHDQVSPGRLITPINDNAL